MSMKYSSRCGRLGDARVDEQRAIEDVEDTLGEAVVDVGAAERVGVHLLRVRQAASALLAGQLLGEDELRVVHLPQPACGLHS